MVLIAGLCVVEVKNIIKIAVNKSEHGQSSYVGFIIQPFFEINSFLLCVCGAFSIQRYNNDSISDS